MGLNKTRSCSLAMERVTGEADVTVETWASSLRVYQVNHQEGSQSDGSNIKENVFLHLPCSWNSRQFFGSMPVLQNEAFITHRRFICTRDLHGHVWVVGCVDTKFGVIDTKIQLFPVTNDTLVMAAILFVPVSMQSNPDTILWRSLIFLIVGEIDELAVSLKKCLIVSTRIGFFFDSIKVMKICRRVAQ